MTTVTVGRAMACTGAVALAMMVGSAAGCHKKKPSKGATSGVRCRIDAKTVKEMAQHGDLSALDPEKRSIYYGLMLERCKGWPPLVEKMIAYIRRPYKKVGAKFTRGPLPKFTDADRADMRKRWNRLCPGYDKVAGKPESKGSLSAERYNKVWKHCGLLSRGALTRWEFVAHRPTTKMLVIMYDELVRGGMNKKAARLLVHLWIIDGPTDFASEHKIAVPVSRSATQMADAVDVILSRTAILVRNAKVARVIRGRVVANAKRDGPDGFFIDKLYKRLRDETKKLRAAEKQGGRPFRGNLIIMADRRTPYRLLAEVIYTANQAEYSQYQVLVSHPDEKARVILFQTPKRVRSQATRTPTLTKLPAGTPPKVQQGPIQVNASSTALVLKHPRLAKPLRFAFDSGRLDDAARRLSLALWKLRAGSKTGAAPQAAGRAVIFPGPKVWLQDVVHILDALRVVPADAKNPPAPKGVSARGCGFTFDRATNQYKLPAASLAGCMYPHAVLGLAAN